MTLENGTTFSRRGFLSAGAGFTFVAAAPVYANAAGYLRGAGKIRQFKMHNDRVGETIDTIYWLDGEYILPALEDINKIMRDWRQNSATRMDRGLINIIAATHNRLDTDEPFTLLSGYRTKRTNNYLRSRGRGVAKNSYHMRAMAADLRIKSRSVSHVARAATSLGGGGVGRYNGSNFTHVDSGPVRTWRG